MKGVAVAIIIGLLLGCSDGIAAKNVSVEEYFQLKCADTPDNPKTWGESVRIIEEEIDSLEGVSPPDELSQYHNASLSGSKAALKFAKSKPENDSINVFEMFGESELMALGMAVSSIEEDFPPDVLKAFESAGCG